MTGMTLIEGPSAWVGCDVQTEDYRVELSAACREQMARVRHILRRGVRFAIVDRLPIAEMDAGEATAIYWLLSSMISRPVAQKLDGTLIYDVLDTGQQAL